jgi:transposase
MVEGTKGSHHKEGSTKMSKHTMMCAGIDTGKCKLDVALDHGSDRLQVENAGEGHLELLAWLRKRRVERIGIEASGGYEQAVVFALRRNGFVVIVFQPAQVRAYAKYQLQRAKNDKIDAALIATCTAEAKKIHPPPDPRLAPFAGLLTIIEQLTDDVARYKTRREMSRDEEARRFWSEEIARLKRLVRERLKQLVTAIRQHRDLAHRLDLIASVEGVGLRTAVAILVRMPEIGRITRGQAAALVGVAPYDADSGGHVGARHVEGGERGCAKASTRLPCRRPSTGTPNSSPSTAVSGPLESHTSLPSSPARASSLSSSTLSSPETPPGSLEQPSLNGCSG